MSSPAFVVDSCLLLKGPQQAVVVVGLSTVNDVILYVKVALGASGKLT